MLTQEKNELLTRVGPGTPCGELLRRYWWPIAVAQELTAEQPTRFVRLLGEDLVLFRDKASRFGLLADHCSHRGASLLYGRVEERGLACAYHGWLYDIQGNCLETPAEPAGSMFHLTVKHRAYPVQKFIGMYWAYLGPQPAPVIPRYDVWARKDGRRWLVVQPLLDCSWLQPTENSVDPAHSHFLHQEFIPHLAIRGGKKLDVEWDFWEIPYGIMKRRVANGVAEDHPLIFPNILRQDNGTQIRVPVDDTHTLIIRVHFEPSDDGSIRDNDEDPSVTFGEPYKDPPEALHPVARYNYRDVQAQDYMAWETQGLIADREHERLATSDRGIVLYRNQLKREIDKVRAGLDPIGVVRDPNHEIIDTNLDHSIRANQRGGNRGGAEQWGTSDISSRRRSPSR